MGKTFGSTVARYTFDTFDFQFTRDDWFDPRTTYATFTNKACVTQNVPETYQNGNGRETCSQPPDVCSNLRYWVSYPDG